MAKAHQDQVNWPYAPPHFYPQPPRSYQLPPYPQGRFCQESCCRRTRAPLPYPHPLPPLPPNLQCRPSQENAYSRSQQSSQVRGFVPVNPYVQQHGGHPQHAQAAVHRPIPQPRYDYNDFYRYGSNTNNTNNHQGFHPAVLKQNTNTYAVNNAPQVAEQYPACSHYTPMEQESTPNLDVRQFLATWQDKDDEVFEADQQQKPKVQYQEPPPNTDVFKPLDCTKRNENPLPMYGYNHSQMNNHPAYYNKPLQTVANHQPLNDTSYKNPPYVTPNAYHPVPVENECNFNTPQVNISPHPLIENDPQHVGYERRIEKIFNPHGCKGISSVPPIENNHCAVDKGNHIELKAPPLPEKNQYHLSASLESEDLFDDINRKREERQRNIVHPLCYQENYTQRMNGNIRSKPDIPQVSVKPNTAANINYPVDNFVAPGVNIHNEMKKPKALPLKKWVQKRKKSDDEFFPSFSMSDPHLDFSTRDTVIERSHIQGPCVPDMFLNINNNNSHSGRIINNNNISSSSSSNSNHSSSSSNSNGINNNNANSQCNAQSFGHVYPEMHCLKEVSATRFSSETTRNGTSHIACIYESVPQIHELVAPVNCLQAPSPSVDCLHAASTPADCLQAASPPPSTPQKTSSEDTSTVSICSDDIDISIASSCDLVISEAQDKETNEEITSLPPLEEKNASLLEKEGTEISDTTKFEGIQNDENDNVSMVLPTEEAVQLVEETGPREKEDQDESSPPSNALKTIAYMYDGMNGGNNISENSLDEPNAVFKSKNYKHRHSSTVRYPVMKRNSKFSLLTLWRYRNRLFPKSISVKLHSKLTCKKRYVREYSKFFLAKKKKTANVPHKGIVKSGAQLVKEKESTVVDVVVSSLLEGVCQIGEVSSQASDLVEGNCQKPREPLAPFNQEKCDTSNSYGVKPDVIGWELAPGDEKVTSTVESDAIEEDDSNMVISEEYIGYAEGSMLDGPDDGVLHGILNWPHHEEEITSINDEKESIKETHITETPFGNEKELHHCLLCQESFTSLDKLHNHENSLSHRHIDIVQRAVLHKLQKSMKGIDLPAFQPLTPSELEYLNWRPNFPGYNHFYHNVPL